MNTNDWLAITGWESFKHSNVWGMKNSVNLEKSGNIGFGTIGHTVRNQDVLEITCWESFKHSHVWGIKGRLAITCLDNSGMD